MRARAADLVAYVNSIGAVGGPRLCVLSSVELNMEGYAMVKIGRHAFGSIHPADALLPILSQRWGRPDTKGSRDVGPCYEWVVEPGRVVAMTRLVAFGDSTFIQLADKGGYDVE